MLSCSIHTTTRARIEGYRDKIININVNKNNMEDSDKSGDTRPGIQAGGRI